MSITYEKLFSLLEMREKNKHWLRQNGILPNTVDRLIKNKHVSTEIIDRVCKLLDCQPADIMEYIPDKS
jgi:DNA-binding Xre family transcriptional regulator